VQVTTNIVRLDMIRLSLMMLFRTRANWIFVAILALVLFVLLVVNKQPSNLTGYLSVLGISVFGGVAGLISGLICQLVLIWFTVGKKSGVLGIHTYTLTDRGLNERTEANEGTQLWQGIQSIKRNSDYMLLQVNSYLFHIVPRRSFGSLDEYEAFWNEANRLWKSA